jgi:hypothetical protein
VWSPISGSTLVGSSHALKYQTNVDSSSKHSSLFGTESINGVIPVKKILVTGRAMKLDEPLRLWLGF